MTDPVAVLDSIASRDPSTLTRGEREAVARYAIAAVDAKRGGVGGEQEKVDLPPMPSVDTPEGRVAWRTATLREAWRLLNAGGIDAPGLKWVIDAVGKVLDVHDEQVPVAHVVTMRSLLDPGEGDETAKIQQVESGTTTQVVE